MRILKIVKFFVLLFFVAFLLSPITLYSQVPRSKKEKLIFAGNADYAPYSYLSDNKPTGYAVDLIKALSIAAPFLESKSLEIRLRPWAECIKELRSGKIDGLIGAPVFEPRETYLGYSIPIYEINFYLFVNSDNNDINSISSLYGMTVGVQEESLIINTLLPHKRIKILQTQTIDSALQKLKSREVSAVIAEKNIASYYIQKNRIENIKMIGTAITPPYKYAIAVKKGSHKLLSDINLGISIVAENGLLQNLKNKWFGLHMIGPFPWKTVILLSSSITGLALLLSGILWVMSLNATVKTKTNQIQLMSRRMIEKDKLAVLGKLAGQIAHELRTPLSIIHNSVFLLRKEGSENRALFEKRLHLLEEKIKLTSNILESILSYTRVKAETASVISIKECISEVINDIEIPTSINMIIDFKNDHKLFVFMDFHQLYSVLRNLILNSIQAMGESGTIIVNVDILEKSKWVSIRICDTGKGIAESARNKIFNLFYSSKITGTGLGLPISKSIIEANNGELSLEETGEEGTCFVLKLPYAKRK